MVDCPTCTQEALAEEARVRYADGENHLFFLNSLRQVSASHIIDENGKPTPCKTRAEEIIDFCKRMNYKKVGLAFCAAFDKQANCFAQMLLDNGFDVVSIICKVGGIEKEDVGLEMESKVIPQRREITCNPIEQAMILNEANTEFNIMLGLCVGHDSLFLKTSNAMCTVLAVKDRVNNHDPLKAFE